MVQYATATELAGYLQQDLDTYSANQVLTIASQLFSTKAETWFSPQTVTYQFIADGCREVRLPYSPVTAVSAVRVAGVTVSASDYVLIADRLYRRTGYFGTPCAFPPALGEADLIHGFTVPGDDVKGKVLETAAQAYSIPVGAVISESIDDYAVRYATTGGGLQLTASALDLAEQYRGPFAA